MISRRGQRPAVPAIVRALARSPARPELLATRPNELYSWDITKLLGPAKWTYYYLYVILDVYSRYAVGWLVAPRETARLAEELIADAIHREGGSGNEERGDERRQCGKLQCMMHESIPFDDRSGVLGDRL